MEAHEGAELVAQSHVNKYLKWYEFKAKVFEQSTNFYATSFNDSLCISRESPALPPSTLCAVEYDCNGEEVEYGPDD